MNVKMEMIRLSAGIIDDNQMLYANAIVIDETIANQVEDNRIDVGQQHAKVKITTENNNALSKSLAVSGLIPGEIEFKVKTSVKQGAMTMEIIDFIKPNGKPV